MITSMMHEAAQSRENKTLRDCFFQTVYVYFRHRCSYKNSRRCAPRILTGERRVDEYNRQIAHACSLA